MDGSKAPWRSLTLVSAVTAAVVALLGALGVAVDGDAAGRAVEAGGQLVSAVLALVAAYGRLRATTRIGR